MKQKFQIKLFLQKSKFLIVFLFLVSCNSKFNFNKVVSSNLLSKDYKVVYNDDSYVKIDTNLFFIDKVECYNKNKDLFSLSISKAEGNLYYSRKMLEDDSLLIDYYRVFMKRNNTNFKKKIVIDNGELYNIIYRSEDTIVSIKNGKTLMFIKDSNHCE